MNFDLTDDQRSWRDSVRAFLRVNVTPELTEELETIGYEGNGPELRRFRRQVGEMGWFGLNWPVEHGGLARSSVDQHLLMEEFQRAGVIGSELTVTSVAPMIIRYGTPENKEDWLPPIARGELTVAVGYSEPDAGTDLASLKTTAVLDGDEWVINGSKIWNSLAHYATHEWLCVRTDPTLPRHRGISVIMVPVDTPGIEIRPLITWADFRTNQTFFTNVRVPKRNLIGEINQGWTYITGALDLERGAVSASGALRKRLDDLIAVCSAAMVGGVRLADKPDIRRRLAELEADVEVARLLGYQTASTIDSGEVPTVAATAEKIYTSELRQKIADLGTQILGMYGQLSPKDPQAPVRGAIERLYREAPLLRFGGGANEVLRDVIAQRGHGMPSYGRTARA